MLFASEADVLANQASVLWNQRFGISSMYALFFCTLAALWWAVHHFRRGVRLVGINGAASDAQAAVTNGKLDDVYAKVVETKREVKAAGEIAVDNNRKLDALPTQTIAAVVPAVAAVVNGSAPDLFATPTPAGQK